MLSHSFQHGFHFHEIISEHIILCFCAVSLFMMISHSLHSSSCVFKVDFFFFQSLTLTNTEMQIYEMILFPVALLPNVM